MDAVLRALAAQRHHEMDLQLWALAQQVRADPASAAVVGAADVDLGAVAAASTQAPSRRPPGRARRVPAPLRPPGRRRDRPRHAPLARAARARARRAGQLPAPRRPRTPHPTPGSPPASGWRSRRSPTSSPASAALPVARAGRRASPSAGCARWSGCARHPKDHLVRLIALARAELASSASSWPRTDCSTRPTTCSSSTSATVRAALAGTDSAGNGRRTPGDLRAGAAPPARAAGPALPTAPSPRRSPGPPPRTAARWSAPPPPRARSRRRPASSSTPSVRGWSPARSSSRRPPTPAGPRCSSPRARW
jgi:hypothetical protein